MGSFVVTNYNDRQRTWLEVLKVKGIIKGYRFLGGAKFEASFEGEVELNVKDWEEVYDPGYVRFRRRWVEEEFKRTLIEIIRTLRGGEVVDTDLRTYMKLRDAEGTRVVSARIPADLYAKLEARAEAEGRTKSDLVVEALRAFLG